MQEKTNIFEKTQMRDAVKVISAFTVFKFIKMMSEPFTKLEAYKLGIINEKGKFLRKVDTLKTQKEKNSVDAFHRLIINLKKVIQKVPDPHFKAQMKTIPTAMILLKDEVEKYGADGNYVLNEIENYFLEKNINLNNFEINQSFNKLLEE